MSLSTSQREPTSTNPHLNPKTGRGTPRDLVCVRSPEIFWFRSTTRVDLHPRTFVTFSISGPSYRTTTPSSVDYFPRYLTSRGVLKILPLGVEGLSQSFTLETFQQSGAHLGGTLIVGILFPVVSDRGQSSVYPYILSSTDIFDSSVRPNL